MKIKVEKKVLKGAMDAIGAACYKLPKSYDSESHKNRPSVLIVARSDKACLTAMNEKIIVQVLLPAEVSEPGSCAVLTKKLADAIPGINQEAVLQEHKDSLVLYEGEESRPAVSIAIPYENQEKFKSFPDFNGETILKGPAFKFAYCLGSVLTAVPSSSTSLPALCNLCVDYGQGQISFVGFDSLQLMKKTVPLHADVPDRKRMVLESESARCMERILRKNKENIQIGISDKFLYIKGDTIKIAVRIQQEQFPDYEILLNEKYDRHFSIERDLFCQQIKSVKGIGNTKEPLPVMFRFDKEGLMLRFVTPDSMIVKTLPIISKEGDFDTFKIIGKTLKNGVPYMGEKNVKFSMSPKGLVKITSGDPSDYVIVTRSL